MGTARVLPSSLSLYLYPTTPGHVWFTDAAPGAKLLQYVHS
jgi:hypothetical protein